MEALFFVLGIIVFVFAKFGDRYNEKRYAYMKQFSDHVALHNETLKHITTTDEYRELETYVESGDHAEEIYEKLKDNLTEVYGRGFRKKFVLPGSGKFKISGKPTTWAIRLLASKQGKYAVPYDFNINYEISSGKNSEEYMLCGQILKNLWDNGYPEARLFQEESHGHRVITPEPFDLNGLNCHEVIPIGREFFRDKNENK